MKSVKLQAWNPSNCKEIHQDTRKLFQTYGHKQFQLQTAPGSLRIRPWLAPWLPGRPGCLAAWPPGRAAVFHILHVYGFDSIRILLWGWNTPKFKQLPRKFDPKDFSLWDVGLKRPPSKIEKWCLLFAILPVRPIFQGFPKENASRDRGVCEKTLLLDEPWPCNPEAETALQPLIWCSESLFSHVPSSLEELFFTDASNIQETFSLLSFRLAWFSNVQCIFAGFKECFIFTF